MSFAAPLHTLVPLRRRPDARKRGMTFLELMIVVAIMGILMLVTAPSLKNFYKGSQIKTATREFVALARYARQEAILRNRTTEIIIHFKEDSYQLSLNPGKKSDYHISDDKRQNSMEDLRLLGSPQQRLFFQTVECASGPIGSDGIVRIRFFKNGSASASTIVLATPSKKMMTVEIAGSSGAIRIYAGPPHKPDTAEQTKAAMEGRP